MRRRFESTRGYVSWTVPFNTSETNVNLFEGKMGDRRGEDDEKGSKLNGGGSFVEECGSDCGTLENQSNSSDRSMAGSVDSNALSTHIFRITR